LWIVESAGQSHEPNRRTALANFFECVSLPVIALLHTQVVAADAAAVKYCPAKINRLLSETAGEYRGFSINTILAETDNCSSNFDGKLTES
jgi:hypothetical protein